MSVVSISLIISKYFDAKIRIFVKHTKKSLEFIIFLYHDVTEEREICSGRSLGAYGRVLIFDKSFAVAICDRKSVIALSSMVFAVAICDQFCLFSFFFSFFCAMRLQRLDVY